MPVYEYLCDDCGPFTDIRPMAECELPSPVRSVRVWRRA
jgi:putative FmdB family regulatory protein